MSKRLILVFKLLLISLIMLAISLLGYIIYTPQVMKTSNASYIDKLDRLASLSANEQAKAVFVGGSATHFGIHAQTFEQNTGIQTVNMGLNAGIDFDLYLGSVKPYLRKDDLLFLNPEYAYFMYDYYDIKASDPEFVVYYNQQVWDDLSLKQKVLLLPKTIDYGWKSWFSFLYFRGNELLKKNLGVYSRSYSNKYGDMFGQKDTPAASFTPAVATPLNKGFIPALTSKLDEMQKMGVKIIWIFPPYEEHSYLNNKDTINKAYKEILSQDNAVVLYSPDNTVYPTDYFFDTYYHLKWDRAEDYTNFVTDKFLALTKDN